MPQAREKEGLAPQRPLPAAAQEAECATRPAEKLTLVQRSDKRAPRTASPAVAADSRQEEAAPREHSGECEFVASLCGDFSAGAAGLTHSADRPQPYS